MFLRWYVSVQVGMRTHARRRSRKQTKDRDRGPDIPSAAMTGDPYKHNGRLCFRFHEESTPSPDIPSFFARYVPLYRYTSNLYARYVAEGRCSEKQLRTIYALMIEGLSMREHARQEGVEPESIRQRILGLANKCPSFYRWWCRLNERRRRKP